MEKITQTTLILWLGMDATAEILGVIIKEVIDNKREHTPSASLRGVFNLGGDGARLFLWQGEFEVSSSPFINASGQVLGRVIFGHSHFKRLASEGSGVVQLVSTENGWGFGACKVVVSCSCTDCGPGCALEGERVELLR